MATKPENVRYEAKRKAAGFVRGPRITAEACEALRRLSYRMRLDPWQVVSALIMESAEKEFGSLQKLREISAMQVHRMSAEEAKDFCRLYNPPSTDEE